MKGLLLLLFAAGCGGGFAQCDLEPAGIAIAFFAGEADAPQKLHARVAGINAQQPQTFVYELHDSSGGLRPLTWRAPQEMPGVIQGGSYDFDFEYRPGWPPAGSIVVRDEQGLVFAAATDQLPGQRVLASGIPGFEVALQEPACPSRPHSHCYRGIFNLPLRITHAGRTVVLHHGQSALLGDYRIDVLTAQRAIYTDRCADAGLSGVSYTIARVPRQ